MGPFGSILFIVVALVLGFAAVAIYFILRFMRRFQSHIDTVEKTPLTSVGQLSSGLHKATGTAVPLDQPLVSPLTQTECVFYHFKVEELRTSQQGTRFRQPGRGVKGPNAMTSTWVPVVNDRQAVPCGIQDETGMAMLDLLGAEMVLKTCTPKQSDFIRSCPPELQETLRRRYDFSTKGLLLSKSLRYTEMVIRPGDKLLVVGDVEANDGESPTFVKREHSFVISDKEEADLLKHYRRHVTGCKVGMGIVAAVACIFIGFPIYAVSQGHKPETQAAKKAQQAPARAEKKPEPPRFAVNQERAPVRPEPKIALPQDQRPQAFAEAKAAPVAEAKITPTPKEKRSSPPAGAVVKAKVSPPDDPPDEGKSPPSQSASTFPINTKVCMVSAANGRLMEADKEKNNRDGNVVVLRTKSGFTSPHRQWVIRREPGTEYFFLVNVESNRLLDGERASSRRDGTKVHLYGTRVDGNKERLWQFKSAGGDMFYIVNVANGRYLDADPMTLDQRATRVRLWGRAGEDKVHRKWRVVRVQP